LIGLTTNFLFFITGDLLVTPYVKRGNNHPFTHLDNSSRLQAYGELCHRIKEGIYFASRKKRSHNIEEHSRPDVPKPALPERLSIQEQLPPDTLVSQQFSAEWVITEYIVDEEEDLYRFLKGGLMAK
jgi:hypothetical protein